MVCANQAGVAGKQQKLGDMQQRNIKKWSSNSRQITFIFYMLKGAKDMLIFYFYKVELKYYSEQI